MVLVGAAVLRLWGIGWGLPGPTHLFSYHPDEFHSLRGALSLLLLGDPNPHFFNYGSLYLYLAAVAARLTGTMPPADLGFDGMAQVLHDWTLAARLVTALCGVLTVAVVYRLGDLLTGRRLAIAGAVALAVMPLHVLHSAYATVDVPQTLFVALVLMYAVRIAKHGTPRDYLLAGLSAGLAASVKYSGALVLVAPLVAHLAVTRCRGAGDSAPAAPLVSVWPLAMLGMAALAFVLTSPYTLLDWAHARGDILYEVQHMRVGEESARAADPSGWLFHGRCLLLATTGLGGLALLGIVGLCRRGLARRCLGPVVFGVLWTALIAGANVRYLRYELPLAPLVAVLGVASALALWGRRPGWRLAALAVPAVAVGLGLGVSLQMAAALRSRPDPRDLARDEVVRRVPPDGAVGMVWEPWFQSAPLDRCNGGQVLRRNPFWSRYADPVRPLVATGLDARRLRAERPLAYLTSNFEVRDWARVRDPNALGFVEALEADYRLAAVLARAAPLDGLWGWQPPQDWLYPFATVNVYLARQRPAASP
jgi:hypothetical protein